MDVLNQTGLLTQISYIKAYVNNAIANQDIPIIDMADYEKPDNTSAIATTDTVVEAIGKLEKALDNKQAAGSYLTTSGTAADSDKLGGTVAANYALKTDLPTVPTDVSDFNNDAGYLTSSNLTGYATETYVDTAVSNLVNSAPATLDTLNELAAALGDDENFATTVSTQLGTKVDTADVLTDAEAVRIWNTYFEVPMTVTITQSTGQTISVTVNGVAHTETFTAPFGSTYTATVTPDTGYTAGTISSASGTIEEAITISATAATLQTFTLTLAATENQTITLTYTEPDEEVVTVTSTNTAQEIAVGYGTTWIASTATSVTGYNAGTLTPGSSGTVTDNVTISASEITIQTFMLTLGATEHQTITLTYTEPDEEAVIITSTNMAQEITVIYGTTWTASIEADYGYDAGILSNSSGTITNDTTISATVAQDKGYDG